ncbi:protein BatD [Pseudoalteromonas distincta]|uniref:BatD family protein n=1 Tax=Pseudoalteromonas distincta TaxID=77608 RepID=A0ABT9GDN3_9GAMM|nr:MULTISPECIES: BatD family protein [Pseudoalteromonas distincta group]KHM50704.1 protein BatD [Pseudoalteromonas elyakovii]KID34977.1 protein BatD [Pseudoalteromonas distincta]MDP4483975.1 BatD family protein [Pseudoalteromonas elyakovii]
MVMRLFCCLLLLSAMPSWAATKLEASVDKNPVLAGEFFMLNISVDDTVKGEQPDTSSLLKDFVVGPTSLSSRTNIINGSINKQTTWSVKLMTRTEGDYTIPAFSVAGLTSEPIKLKVAKRSADADKNNEIFLKTSLSSNSLFVQEAGVYTVKLYLAKELLDGSLSTPSMEDAQLTQLGKQTESYELVDGKRYLVITREYLIQPQKSGAYTIAGPAFQGRVQQNYRQLEVSALGDDQQVEIKPIPSDYKGAWLPSELVNLDEEWQPNDNTVEVGTPITRTITLTALGVTKEQLPEISMPTIDGIRSYPDKKENNNAVRDGRVVSQQTASYALLPQKPGTYTLPEIKLPWFNTKMNRISVATLPKRTITVTPSTTAPNTAIANPQPSTNNSPTLENISNQATGTQPIETKSDTPLWLIVVAASGYILWIGTVIFYLISRSTKNTTEKLQLNTRGISQPSLNELKALAKTHDVKAFYTALNNFSVKVTHKNVGAIDELCIRVNSSELNGLISQLQAQLYSNKGANTDLNAIIKILENYQTQASKSQQAVLKDLYD